MAEDQKDAPHIKAWKDEVGNQVAHNAGEPLPGDHLDIESLKSNSPNHSGSVVRAPSQPFTPAFGAEADWRMFVTERKEEDVTLGKGDRA